MGKRYFMSQRMMAEAKKKEAVKNARENRGEEPKRGNNHIIAAICGCCTIHVSTDSTLESPKPKPKSDDTEKIIRLGFDPKTSFRKRKSKQ